jgi:PAS domain-containing protein
MQTSPIASPDFVAVLAEQRQRLLRLAGSLLGGDDPAGLPSDRVPKLTQCLASSLEELKVAEEELFDQHLQHETTKAEQERRLAYFRALFHHAPTPLVLTTTDGAIRAANRTAAALVMRDVFRLEGKPIAALGPAESRPEFRRQLGLVLKAGGVRNWCFTLLRQADGPIRVDASIELLPPEIVGARAFYWHVRPVVDAASLTLTHP